MKLVFENPAYDLNKTVENELDFLLGAVFASILERNAMYLMNRNVRPTDQDSLMINHFLFSKAPEFKELIKRLLGV